MKIICPRCGSDAYYSYGRTQNGKQRYLCLMCNRQFVKGAVAVCRNRPACPLCQSSMHVYMRTEKSVRFRCSNYPECRGYAIVNKEEDET